MPIFTQIMDHKTKENQMLDIIRNIILEVDREAQGKIREDVDLLKKELLEEEQFYSHLDPYFEQKITYLQANFPSIFGPFISTAIKMQIRDSRDEVVDALYPIIGKLVQKYINYQMQELGERIDNWFKNITSASYWFGKVKDSFTGKQEDLSPPSFIPNPILQEVFVIENDSGLLIGHYSFNNLLDADMIAGMLMGIKSFVEQAFQKGPQELEEVGYSEYRLMIYSAPHFYIVFVLDGIINPSFKRKMYDKSIDLIEAVTVQPGEGVSGEIQEKTNHILRSHFDNFNQNQSAILPPAAKKESL